MPPRPPKIRVGPYIARPVRPPGVRTDLWYWRAEEHIDGQTRTVLAGRYSADGITEALARLLTSQPSPTARPRGLDTIRDLLEVWVEAMFAEKRHAKQTRLGYRSTARKLAKYLGDVPIDSIDQRAVNRYRDQARREGRADPSIGQDIVVLQSAYRWARQEDYTAATVPAVQDISRKPISHATRYTPTREEVQRIMGRLDPERWTFLVIAMIAGTGCRPHELARSRWLDFDLRRSYWRVPEQTKTGARTVPLRPELVALLRKRRPDDPSGRVVPYSEHHIHKWATTDLRLAVAREGVPDFTLKGLRRLAVNELYRAVDPGTAGAVLGHSSETALRYYREVRGADLDAAMGALGAVFAEE